MEYLSKNKKALFVKVESLFICLIMNLLNNDETRILKPIIKFHQEQSNPDTKLQVVAMAAPYIN